MKRLLLASNGAFVVKKGFELFFDDLSKIRLAHITTAQKGVDDRRYIKWHQKDFKKKGIEFEEVDLDGKRPDDLREILKDKNVIYVDGGNTFYLLKAIRESGFEEVLREFIESGGVYIGTSAGSYVACPTIEMSTWKKDQKERFGVTDLAAMNFVPFLIKAHYDEEMRSEIEDKVASAKYPTRILRDGQAILIEDGKVSFVGDGEEVKF
jgi:dipeptidase E